MNNRLIKKNIVILFSIMMFLIEVLMIFLIIKSVLTKDLISPNDVTFYEYLKVKLSNFV